MNKFICAVLGSFALIMTLASVPALADGGSEFSAKQEALSTSTELKGGIRFLERQDTSSDIAHLEVSFRSGTYDLPEDSRAVHSLLFDVMPMASKRFSKDQVFEMTEKLSLNISCDGLIEFSVCRLETVRGNLAKGLELFLSLVTEPRLDPKDIDVARTRRIAMFESDQQSPEKHVNNILNRVFYEPGHPYRMLPEDAVAKLKRTSRRDLERRHRDVLNAASMNIVYVGKPLSTDEKNKMAALLSGVKRKRTAQIQVEPPKFDSKKRIVFEHRDIPTAYIRAKFSVPGVQSKDAAVTRLLFEILSENLHEEVRTKRSLSYAVHAHPVQLKEGIGMIAASTSNPKETIKVMAEVIQNLKKTLFSKETLNEYKNVFTTSHFLTLESHDSFASALLHSLNYFGRATEFYQFLDRIEMAKAEDLQRVAKESLTKLRIGVIFDKDKFESSWLDPLLEL